MIKIAVSADYTSDGHGSYANIYLSQCFEERTCGLCGDNTHDFTYVDIQRAVQNEDGSIDTTQDVLDIFELANDHDLWQSTQEFDFEYSATYVIVAIEQDEDNYYVVPEQPNFECLGSACRFCEDIGCNCNTQGFDLDIWLQNCALMFDACATCGATLQDSLSYPSYAQVQAAGCSSGAKLV